MQLDPAKVTVSLSERDVVSLSEGMPAKVSLPASAGLVLPGKVKHIQRAADLKTRTFIAEIEVDNEEERGGSQARATIGGGDASASRQTWVTRLAAGPFVHTSCAGLLGGSRLRVDLRPVLPPRSRLAL